MVSQVATLAGASLKVPHTLVEKKTKKAQVRRCEMQCENEARKKGGRARDREREGGKESVCVCLGLKGVFKHTVIPSIWKSLVP